MHVIRLHGPWTAEFAHTGESRRVHLPRDWAELGDLAQQAPVRLLRRFHRPTGLERETQVRLAIPVGWPLASLQVNGEPVPEHTTDEERRTFDLSTLIRLREAHDLMIEFSAGGELADQPYFVAIEIDELA